MTKLLEYLEDPNRLLLCDRQGLHREEPLDLVCLDPLCRNNPLGCSVCFNEVHKFHRVITLAKFYDDYRRNAKKYPQAQLAKQIREAQQQVNGIIRSVRETVNKAIDNFEVQVRNYTDYLFSEMEVRQQISRELGIELDGDRMKKLCNLWDLRKTVGFVLNNSEFDEDNNMTDVSQLLVANSSRVLALTSKLEYMTLNCNRAIQDAVAKLSFASDTIREEKITAKVNMENAQCDELKEFAGKASRTDNKKPAYFQEYKNMPSSSNIRTAAKDQSVTLMDPHYTPAKKKQNPNISQFQTDVIAKQYSSSSTAEKPSKVKFGLRFLDLRHPALRKDAQGTSIRSSINALKPQFALAEPHLELQPLKVSKWVVRIGRCRNLSCLNTLALGLVHRKEIEENNFEARSNQLQQCYLLTSQGDVILPGRHYRNEEMRFSEGSVLDFKYDPYYCLLEIKKENGKLLTIRVTPSDNDNFYFCARLTYASDQVQIEQL